MAPPYNALYEQLRHSVHQGVGMQRINAFIKPPAVPPHLPAQCCLRWLESWICYHQKPLLQPSSGQSRLRFSVLQCTMTLGLHMQPLKQLACLTFLHDALHHLGLQQTTWQHALTIGCTNTAGQATNHSNKCIYSCNVAHSHTTRQLKLGLHYLSVHGWLSQWRLHYLGRAVRPNAPMPSEC